MKNDAKLGMLAGVLGVLVAAVLFANAPPAPTPARSGATDPSAKDAAAKGEPAPPAATPGAPHSPPAGSTAALPATSVGRARKDVDAQPASRSAGADEEP